MNMKYVVCTVAAVLVLFSSIAEAEDRMQSENVEESTVSPIADMAMLETDMSTSTEKPPVVPTENSEKPQSQRHNIGEFIIHPLIAFKPRLPEDDTPAGRQASTTTTPSPWQLFGFNAGAGLGSSVSSLAGSVSGWFNDRIQLPGLVDTPVRDSSSSTSTTTTTERPDVVVRVQHRASTRRPLITINSNNRPNRLPFDSEEEDDEDFEDDEEEEYNDAEEQQDDDDEEEERPTGNRKRKYNSEEDSDNNDDEEDNEEEVEDDDDEAHADDDDDEEEEEFVQRPNSRRRPVHNQRRSQQLTRADAQRQQQKQQQRRRVQVAQNQSNKRRGQQQQQQQKRRQSQPKYEDSYEDELEDEQNYYGTRHSTKRSQSQPNLIQRGQQTLINQIRQLTRGQSPAEISAAMNRQTKPGHKRRQQGTLLINRNGQTVYMAPELLNSGYPKQQQKQGYQYYAPQNVVMKKRPNHSQSYPQPPLTMPVKRKGYPTQYLTIPWSQLGISPPNQLVSIADGIQSQPLILNIPQSAINQMQNDAQHNKQNKKQRPIITADAVPLLAEASLMDIFKPPRIPPSRHSNAPTKRPLKTSTALNVTPALLPQRIRPATIVEKDTVEQSDAVSASNLQSESEGYSQGEQQYIVVGHDDEPGLTRQALPIYADQPMYTMNFDERQPFYEYLNQRGRFALRKTGRSLEPTAEQQIPVQVINDDAQIMSVPAQSSTPVAAAMPETAPAVELPVVVDEIPVTPSVLQPVEEKLT